MPMLEKNDHKKKLVVVKIEKSYSSSMEIYRKKEVDFDFKAYSFSFEDEDIRLVLVHFSPWAVLPRDANNIEYTYSSYSYNVEEDNVGQFGNKMVGKIQLHVLDNHIQKLNSSKVVLSTRGAFKEFDTPNYSSIN